MPDLFNDLNKILKKDLVPILIKYFKDPNNKITDNLNVFLNDQRTLLNDIFQKFSNNKDNDIMKKNNIDDENISEIDVSSDKEYDDLLKRLNLIEENMIQIEKILKDKN